MKVRRERYFFEYAIIKISKEPCVKQMIDGDYVMNYGECECPGCVARAALAWATKGNS